MFLPGPLYARGILVALLSRGHLGTRGIWKALRYCERSRKQKQDILGTPPLDDAREPYLFGVVGDQWTQLEDSPPEMAIRAPHNMRFSHSWSQRTQDLSKALVIELLRKCTIFVCRWCATT